MGCTRCQRENFTLWVVSCSYSEAHGIRTPLYLILRWTAARGPRVRRGCAQLGGSAPAALNTLARRRGRLRSTLSVFLIPAILAIPDGRIGLRSIKQVFPPLGIGAA